MLTEKNYILGNGNYVHFKSYVYGDLYLLYGFSDTLFTTWITRSRQLEYRLNKLPKETYII